jgi:hypothetical protein
MFQLEVDSTLCRGEVDFNDLLRAWNLVNLSDILRTRYQIVANRSIGEAYLPNVLV